MTMQAYQQFLESKRVIDPMTGLASVPELPDAMFGFQRDITSWCLRRGRAALFAGTGLGKSFMELAWADAVHRETGRNIIHFAPLAVSAQMAREADKFGIVARQARSQAECLSGTSIVNYQKLDRFGRPVISRGARDGADGSGLQSNAAVDVARLAWEGSMRQADNICAVDQVVTGDYAIYQGDACELIRAIPGDSIHFGIHSPPFEGLYKFSSFDRDISNSEGEAFWQHYAFLIGELLRVTMPGRLHSVHVMQLPTSKTRNGFIGMRDFRGDVVRAYEGAGWCFHSEVCIWKDPVIAQQRTKSLRLLHKQVAKDSSLSGQRLADYIVTFRKPGENPEPLAGMFTDYVGEGLDISDAAYRRYVASPPADDNGSWKPWPLDMWRSVLVWQRYASPVWMDVSQTRTLQYRSARDEKDEVHISPLQLDVIERCIDLWSAPGEVVLTPFLGIGSEVFAAVERNRRGIGFELKPSYFAQAVKNVAAIHEGRSDDLFEASP